MPETNFFWDPLSDNILQERDETGAVTAEYTAEPGLYGNVISQDRGGVESQFHYDALGSTLAATSGNQQITDARSYSSFGETVESSGNTELQSQYVGRFGYVPLASFEHYSIRRRHYVPGSGRWLSSDPLVELSYVFSDNNP